MAPAAGDGKDIAVLFSRARYQRLHALRFYFLPVDADLEKLKRTGSSQADITSTVGSIAGKVLVFMDACHSGNLMGKLKRRGLVVLNSVITKWPAENGAVVFSSPRKTVRAGERGVGQWGLYQGVVEGIRGKADYRATGRSP